MYYVSTRDRELRLTASGAIARGLAEDGGLLTPGELPRLPGAWLEEMAGMTYEERAVYVMKPFLEEFSREELASFAGEAYGGGKFTGGHPAPVRKTGEGTYCLELWHGPTCAFKDMALQMLPHLLTASLRKEGEERKVCILTATSGDTGKAALEGFRDVEGTGILVFYPRNGVSAVQQLQMVTQEGSNVSVCAVEGNFDDAQTGVKRLFADRGLREQLSERGYLLSSANSINFGRVLPQIVYYVSAYCSLVSEGALAPGDKLNICVPTGNFGNILAAWCAGEMGVPIGKLLCASNANRVLTDFFQTGIYDRRREFHQTISPSMDILISSNLERLLFFLSDRDDGAVRAYMDALGKEGCYRVEGALWDRLRETFRAGSCNDREARETIARLWRRQDYLIDPHTAVAFHVLDRYRQETGDAAPALVVSTASPFKFCPSVLEALGEKDAAPGVQAIRMLGERTGVEPPKPLIELAGKQIRFTESIAKECMAEQVLRALS